MTSPTIEKAKLLFREAHDSIGQKRKYELTPYWYHTERVADMVSSYTTDEEIIIAAAAHDVIEDITPCNPTYCVKWIEDNFGSRVTKFVIELTDVYTHEAFPQMTRRERKQAERSRLSLISAESQLIKAADLFDNSSSIVKYDEGFAKTYLVEKLLLLPLLNKAPSELLYKAYSQIINALNEKRWTVKIESLPPVLCLEELKGH